ncbi:MAG: hypothetical protein AB1416_09945 [Actinomycetota bacterium]
MRSRALIAAAIAGAVVAVAGAPLAAARTVEHPVELVVEERVTGPNSCSAKVFAQFAEVPGATRYTFTASNTHLPMNREQTWTGPPFDDLVPIPRDLAPPYVAPPGTHRFSLAGAGGGGGSNPDPGSLCDQASGSLAGQFTGARLTVEIPDDRFRLSGTVRARECTTPGQRCKGPNPRAGVAIRAVRVGGGGSGSAVSDAAGAYAIALTKGTYRVTPSSGKLEFEPPSRTVTLNGDRGGVDFETCVTDPAAGVRDACSDLQVTVKAAPSPIKVAQSVAGAVPAPVTVTVTVRNRGKRPVRNVTLQDELLVSARGARRAVGKSLRQRCTPPKGKGGPRCGPTPERLGTLGPGQRKSGVYTYDAYGNASLTLTALVTSSTGRAIGFTNLDIDSPLLVVSATRGPSVASPNAPRVRRGPSGTLRKVPRNALPIVPGTVYAIRTRLENRSFDTPLTLVLLPFSVTGNSRGGVWQRAGGRIQGAFAPSDTPDPAVLPRVVELDPQQKADFDVLYTADASAFASSRTDRTRRGGGGTRAIIRLVRPVAMAPGEDGTLAGVRTGDVVIDPDGRSFAISIDDSAPERTPLDARAAAVEYSIGAVQGGAAWVGATVHGLVVDLPVLAGRGLLAIPAGYVNLLNYEVGLWTAVREDPAVRADVARAMSLILAENAAAIERAGGDAAVFYQAATDEFAARYDRMANDWYAGDWQRAAREIGAEATQKTLDGIGAAATGRAAGAALSRRLGKALGPAAGRHVLLREFANPASGVRRAVLARRAALNERVARALGAPSWAAQDLAPLGRVKVGVALGTLRSRIEPGFEFGDAMIRQLFGLTQEQIDFARAYAKRTGRSLVYRSRAAEAEEWERLGAVLKLEDIKLKNVDWIDAEFLGYLPADIGRVIIKRPISKAELQRRLRNRGITPKNPDGTPNRIYESAVKRWQQRVEEWTSNEPGNVKQIRQWARDRGFDSRYNWGENVVDPAAAPLEAPTRIGLRLTQRKNAKGKPLQEWELEVDPTNTGDFRGITADVDAVAYTEGSGRALSDRDHVQTLLDMRTSPFKSPHADTVTWTKAGSFDFPLKRKYLPQDCCLLQFGPDGVARAVRLDLKKSQLVSADNFFLHFEGGYVHLDLFPSLAAGRAAGGGN